MTHAISGNPVNEVFGSGAQRDTRAGKGRYDLISPFMVARLAKLLEYGVTRYSARNWEKGFPFGRCLDSAKRHINCWERREPDTDHDDNLAAAVFNLMCLMHYEEMIEREMLPRELDDRPRYHPAGPACGCSVCRFVQEAQQAQRASETRGAQERLQVEDIGSESTPVSAPMPTPMPGSVPERLRFYVSGPFSADTATDRIRNLNRAVAVGLALARKGHLVHVPHAATSAWHGKLPYEYFMELDLSLIASDWVTAVFRVSGPSAGADRETAQATCYLKPVYTRLEDVPDGPALPA